MLARSREEKVLDRLISLAEQDIEAITKLMTTLRTWQRSRGNSARPYYRLELVDLSAKQVKFWTDVQKSLREL